MRADGEMIAFVAVLAGACAPPIQCPPHHTVREETMCPPCSPDDPCECTEGWVCREDPEHSDARRRARLEREAREARANAAAKADADQGARELEGRRREEESRQAEERRRAAEEERARQESAHPAPQSPPASCDEPCPSKRPRWTRYVCATPDSSVQSVLTLPCPESPPPQTRGCPVDWRIDTVCEGPPDPPRASTCRAPPGRCCLPDGTIIRPCGPIARPDCQQHSGMCGSGGFCTGCRCLPPDARVLTPRGEVELRSFRRGDDVVSLTSDGERTNAVVLRVAATPILTPHRWVVVRLDSGRTIRGSGSHPLADGRTFSELEVGDRVDHSRVVSVESVPSDVEATWDILPSGETGVYFVDGVALRSTLR